MALSRVVGGLVMVLPVLQCLTSLTYHFGDGTYFRGTVDNTGRPAQGELYTKDQQLRYNGTWRGGLFHGKGVWKEAGHTYKGGFLYGKAAGEGVWETDKGEDFSMGRESGERLATLTREDFFMARLLEKA